MLPLLHRPGTIVFNASANALRPEARFADYNASKAAVASLAKTMALELSAEGVSVMAVCPGYFPSSMTAASMADPMIREELLARIPARRFGDLSEIAQLVSFLFSPAAAFMTGSLITIDGATTV